MIGYDVVIPTVGRESLADLLLRLDRLRLPGLQRMIAVDDSPDGIETPDRSGPVSERLEILRSGARGPAAARNLGWRHASAEWVVFLDDDVVPTSGWGDDLLRDLDLPGDVAATQGRISVPLPPDRRPTDWERSVFGLENAIWATADMAYRRAALAEAGGFDEGFPRAYREDSELALRVLDQGHRIVRGDRTIVHPPGSAGPWVSLRKQRGNADDARMRHLHGPEWRQRAGAPPGRLPLHVATTASLAAAAINAARGKWLAAGAGFGLWAALTGRFAYERIAPGPRTVGEISRMLATSVLIPPAAVFHRLRGEARSRLVPAREEPRETNRASRSDAGGSPVKAVLLDRDGTLIHDVPYNGDPELVDPLPGAAEALERLRQAGLRTAVITNQSGIGRGTLTEQEVIEVNARAARMLELDGPWFWCPHAPDDGCECRKPKPGLVLRAARELGVSPRECVVVGDIGSDVEAARAAGARSVLVPTVETLHNEVRDAPVTATHIGEAVDLILEGALP